MRIVCVVLALSGCAVAQQMPTLRYCDSVSYVRQGREITITAHCFEAVDPAIPLPIVKP